MRSLTKCNKVVHLTTRYDNVLQRMTNCYITSYNLLQCTTRYYTVLQCTTKDCNEPQGTIKNYEARQCYKLPQRMTTCPPTNENKHQNLLHKNKKSNKDLPHKTCNKSSAHHTKTDQTKHTQKNGR